MAKRKIVWTQKANAERKDILEYWINKNKSKIYSIKLNKLFIESLKILSEHPNIGRQTSDNKTRVRIVRDYLIFYEVTKTEIIIQSIWDGRREENKSDSQ